MKKIIDIFHKLNVIYDKKQKLKFCFLFILILISAFLEIIGISLIFPFINIVINQETITAGGKISQIYNFLGLNNIKTFLILISVSLIFVYVLKNIYILMVCYFQYKILYSAQKNISLQLISFYLKQPYSYHLEMNSSSIIRNLTSDTEQCSEFLVNFFFLLTDFVVCILILFLLFFINKLITAVLIFLFLLMFLGAFGILKSKLKIYANKNFKNRSEMIKWIQQAFESIKDIKILQKEKFFINQYYDSSSNFLSTQKNFNLLQQLPRLFIETFIIVIIITIIIFLLIKNADTASMIAQMAVFAMAAFRLAPSLNRMQISLNNMMFFMPALDAVYNALKNKKEKVFIEQDENKQIDLKKEISVNNISFKYKKTNKYVFNNVSFKIKCGNSIGIIGPTGSGKTTIVDVILGLLNPSGGTVTVDDVDIHKNKKEWFSKIGYVPQMIYLTDDTIKNNILFYDDNNEDEEQLNKVIEQAQLKVFIDSLPDGAETMVGERGIRLSGGQRQRIGIARALYKKPELLVLDEATSALDNNTEKYVMEAIGNLYGKITMIIIAHRLTTIEKCDVVYELKNGMLNIIKK